MSISTLYQVFINFFCGLVLSDLVLILSKTYNLLSLRFSFKVGVIYIAFSLLKGDEEEV